MQNLSHENDFDLHENEAIGATHFYRKLMVEIKQILILTQGQGATWKQPINTILGPTCKMYS